MKIKNLKYYSTIFLLATAISFTGCNTQTKNNKKSHISVETEYTEISSKDTNTPKRKTTETNTKEIKKVLKEIRTYFNNSISLEYYDEVGHIVICGSTKERTVPELTEDLYDKLNKILEQEDIKSIEIHRLDNEINFSKLNISNINDISINNCKDDFNYKPFQNQNYKSIAFEGIPSEQAIEIVKSNNATIADIDYVDLYKANNTSEFIQFLADTNIKLNNLWIATTEFNKTDHINLSKVNAMDIEIMFSSPKNQIYNLDIHPHENTKNIRLIHTGDNIELGNIKVTTEQPSFNFSLNAWDSIMTENTSFNLPDESIVNISTSYLSGNALQDLVNVSKLDFYDRNIDYAILYNNETEEFEEAFSIYSDNKELLKELQ